jgi:hypothetical protein
MSTEESVVIPPETRAKEMGWAPIEEWRGDPEKWIDAETFISRGEEILPIVRANNRKLQDEVTSLKNELMSTRSQLQASTEAIEELKQFNSEANRERMRAARSSLVDSLKEARQEGDVEAEIALTGKIAETDAALRTAETSPPPKRESSSAPLPPEAQEEFNAWASENEWFSDPVNQAAAVAVAAQLRRDPANASLKGRAFFDKVGEETSKRIGINPRRSTAKVDVTERGAGSDSGRQTFTSLPPDARAACDRQASRLVGPNRAYKDLASWRAAYTKQFFSME